MKKIVFYLLSVCFSLNAFAQTSVFDLTFGPEGGSINDAVYFESEDIFIIATDNGIFAGYHENANSFDIKFYLHKLQGIKINKIDYDDIILDDFGRGKIYHATEEGLYVEGKVMERFESLSLTDIVTGDTIYPNVTDVEVIGDTLNVIANGAHLYSLDGGETWNNGQSASNPHEMTKITGEDTVLTLSHTVPFSAKASVSFDCGATWEIMDTGLPDYPEKLASTSTNTYVLSGSKLFRADFDASEWLTQIVDTVNISGFHAENDNVLLWDSAWIFLYNDKDESKLELPDFEYPDNISFGGAYKTTDELVEVIAGTESSGLFNYIEGETDTWQRQIDGLTATDVTTMFINPDNFNLFAGTSNGEIHETADEGINWDIKGKLPGTPLDLVRTEQGTLTAISAEINFGDIYRSTNEGVSWDLVQEGDFQHLAVTDSNYILATDYYTGLHISKDDGQTWNTLVSGFSLNDAIYAIHIAQNGNIYISTYSRVYFSDNGGYNWNLLSEAQSNDLTTINDTLLFSASNSGILRYNFNEALWENVLPEQEGNKATHIISIEDILVAGFQNGAVYRSTDITNKSTAFSINWEMLNPPGVNKQINGIAGFVENDSLKIFIAPEGSAVWRSWSMPETSTHVEKISKTKDVRLKIYPNPAGNHITLEFNNLHADQLIVTDLSGRKLIHSKNVEHHNPALNIRHLQTGIYIVQAIRKNKIIATGKFVKTEE